MKETKLIAYCLTKNMKCLKEEDIQRLDAIHFAFGLIEKGKVYWNGREIQKEIARIKKINPQIQLVLSIGGWGADGFSQAAATGEGRKLFADSAIEILKREQLDGLDIDWEYPCISDAGIIAMDADKENFTLLLKELREGLKVCDSYKTLSIAAGGLDSYLEATNMGEVAQYLDYVQLMTYDYHGGFSKTTGHLANLYGSRIEPDAPNADRTVALFVKAGVPIEKLVMGAAFYGREWSGVPAENNGLGQKASVTEDKFRGYDEIMKLLDSPKSGFCLYRDNDAKAAYAFNGSTFISFEDKEALACKCDYVKEHNMYGMMYWEYAQDRSFILTSYLYERL